MFDMRSDTVDRAQRIPEFVGELHGRVPLDVHLGLLGHGLPQHRHMGVFLFEDHVREAGNEGGTCHRYRVQQCLVVISDRTGFGSPTYRLCLLGKLTLFLGSEPFAFRHDQRHLVVATSFVERAIGSSGEQKLKSPVRDGPLKGRSPDELAPAE